LVTIRTDPESVNLIEFDTRLLRSAELQLPESSTYLATWRRRISSPTNMPPILSIPLSSSTIRSIPAICACIRCESATSWIDLWNSNGFRAWANFPDSIRLNESTSLSTCSERVSPQGIPHLLHHGQTSHKTVDHFRLISGQPFEDIFTFQVLNREQRSVEGHSHFVED